MKCEELTYAYKFGSKTFTGSTTKDAYMKAVKWYATAVISKDKIHGIHAEFVKSKTEPKVTITLWAALDESTVREEHCKICREMHSVFYSNTNYDCNMCSVLGYLKRLEQKASIKAYYCRGVLGKDTGGTVE